MVMARSLLHAYLIILKLEETIAKCDRSKEIWTKQTKYQLEKSEFRKNGKFDFCNPLQSL